MTDNKKIIEAINRHLLNLNNRQLLVILRLLFEFGKNGARA